MRVLIVGEGKHERSGAFESFVRRLSPQNDLEFESDRLARSDIHASHGKGSGYFKKAVRWMLEAKKREFDGCVLVVDEDGKPERRSEIDLAQESPLGIRCRALGVAVRQFDAWMLADERALTQVLGGTVQRQRAPEEISDPKRTCEQLRDAAQSRLPLSEMYAGVAHAADLTLLAERCPRGFAPFADRLRTFLDAG